MLQSPQDVDGTHALGRSLPEQEPLTSTGAALNLEDFRQRLLRLVGRLCPGVAVERGSRGFMARSEPPGHRASGDLGVAQACRLFNQFAVVSTSR